MRCVDGTISIAVMLCSFDLLGLMAYITWVNHIVFILHF